MVDGVTQVGTAKSGRVQVLNETDIGDSDGWRLCLQRARYVYDDGSLEEGFRFIWRRPNGTMQGARGQARIPSLKIARILMARAEEQGWGGFAADDSGRFPDV
jgi:hypothetical protein